MRWGRRLARLLALIAALATGLPEPAPLQAATRSSQRTVKKRSASPRSSARRPARKTVKKKPVKKKTAARKRTTRRPTAAERRRQRAEEKRRREAARREAERQQREALKKAWQPDKGCYQAGAAFSEPKLQDDDPIIVPRSARGGALKAALLMYEAHVDKSGHLYSLRTLRPLPREHPYPMLHDAVVSALKGWTWDKTKLAGKTIEVCFPLTLNLDLR